MGNLTAEILAEEFDLSVGLREHITHNHYPPLPSAYVDIARHAINVYNNTYNGSMNFHTLALEPLSKSYTSTLGCSTQKTRTSSGTRTTSPR